MSGKRTYNRISDETRKRIIEAYENCEDWQLVAKMNGVNYKTAYSWIHSSEIRYARTTQRGHRPKILSEIEVNSVLDWVSEDPTVTLEILSLRLKSEFLKSISTSTISRYLDGQCITLKKLCKIPVSWMSLETQELRRSFVLQLLECYKDKKTICWFDECNFNLFCTRSMGRSKKGVLLAFQC